MSKFKNLKFGVHSLALAACSSIISCDTPPSGTCDEDERPREFCSDIHAEFNLQPKDWTCIAKDCVYPIITPDGCVRIKESVDKGIAQTHECLVDDPSVEDASSSTGSGGWDSTSGSESTPETSDDSGSSTTTVSGSVGTNDNLGSTGTTGNESSSTDGESADASNDDDSSTSGDMTGTSSESDSTSSNDDTSDTESGCEDEMCKNGGSCVDDACACVDGFDPAINCAECEAGRILIDDRCIIDPCTSDPCNLSDHGKSCTTSFAGDAVCMCMGDYTPESNCTKCPAGEEPSTGHDCVPSDKCDGVICGQGASCDGSDGMCSCDDPNTWFDTLGNCVNPCNDDPCNISGGNGNACMASSATNYLCTCDGGHTPTINCEDCPPGKMSHMGQCVNECTSECSSGDRECKTPTVAKTCVQEGACWVWEDESCGNGRCVPSTRTCGAPEGMVEIPGGRFTHASGATYLIDDYFLDKYEATLGAYERCVSANACPARAVSFGCHSLERDNDDQPTDCITWMGAVAFCEWQSKQLPSLAHWQWAATGRAENRRYPWGNASPSCSRVVWEESGTDGCGLDRTAVVGTKPMGESRDGVANMAGNVSEWVSDAGAGLDRKVVASGAYNLSDPSMLEARFEGSLHMDDRGPSIGVRCYLESQ